MSAPGADREGRLISTMIDVMLAGLCDPPRFRRGRDYARQGAVIDLVVTPGRATAQVQGSRAKPYTVVIRATQQDATDRLATLVPSRDDVHFDCDCPDWDSPCKHGVAAMVFLSERIAYEPTLLTTWRGADPERATPRAMVGSRASTAAVEAQAPQHHLDAGERAALESFLGTSVPWQQPAVTPMAPPPTTWDEPWSFMLNDALTVLSHRAR